MMCAAMRNSPSSVIKTPCFNDYGVAPLIVWLLVWYLHAYWNACSFCIWFKCFKYNLEHARKSDISFTPNQICAKKNRNKSYMTLIAQQYIKLTPIWGWTWEHARRPTTNRLKSTTIHASRSLSPILILRSGLTLCVWKQNKDNKSNSNEHSRLKRQRRMYKYMN